MSSKEYAQAYPAEDEKRSVCGGGSYLTRKMEVIRWKTDMVV